MASDQFVLDSLDYITNQLPGPDQKPDKPFKPEQVLGSREKAEPGIETEQNHQEDIGRKLNESQISYLQRAGELVTKKLKEKLGLLFDPGRIKETELPQEALDMIDDIMSEALRPQEFSVNLSRNEETIKHISEIVGYHDKSEFTDSDSFDKTQRNRNFFKTDTSSAKRETYWNTLFFPYNTEATRNFAKQMFDNKTIVLLGGGRSQIKTELNEYGIHPNKIVNVDPFVENIEESADTVIPLSATDRNFKEQMHENGIEGADEILAEYSVPAYLEKPEDIKQLMQNIDQLLIPGGTARIWPIMVGGRGDKAEQIARKDTLIESVRNISRLNKYEISVYESAGRPGLTLYKLALSKEELQQKEDQQKIEEIIERS